MINLTKLSLLATLLCCSAAYAKPISKSELLDVALIGLDIHKSTAKDIYKKYKVSSSCRTGSAGIYINNAKKTMLIGNTFDPVSETSLLDDHILLEITSIAAEGEAIVIAANSAEYGKFRFSFAQIDDKVLTLTLKEAPPPRVGYSSWELSEAYTLAKDQAKYPADPEDSCDEYEG